MGRYLINWQLNTNDTKTPKSIPIGLVYPGLGVKIELRRHLGFHLTQSYMPSTMFVIVGWISFMVPSDAIPGRMVVCVTTLLTLTSMFDSVRYMNPDIIS